MEETYVESLKSIDLSSAMYVDLSLEQTRSEPDLPLNKVAPARIGPLTKVLSAKGPPKYTQTQTS